jgi:hypothetical protein
MSWLLTEYDAGHYNVTQSPMSNSTDYTAHRTWAWEMLDHCHRYGAKKAIHDRSRDEQGLVE